MRAGRRHWQCHRRYCRLAGRFGPDCQQPLRWRTGAASRAGLMEPPGQAAPAPAARRGITVESAEQDGDGSTLVADSAAQAVAGNTIRAVRAEAVARAAQAAAGATDTVAGERAVGTDHSATPRVE